MPFDPLNQSFTLLASLPIASSGEAWVIDNFIYFLTWEAVPLTARFDWQVHQEYWLDLGPPGIRAYWERLANQPTIPDAIHHGGSPAQGMMPAQVDTQKRLWKVSTDNDYDEITSGTIYAVPTLGGGGFEWTAGPGSYLIDQNRLAGSYAYSTHVNTWIERGMKRYVQFGTPVIDSQGRVYSTGGIYDQHLGWIELYFDDYDPGGGTGHITTGYYWSGDINIRQSTGTCERYSPASDSWDLIPSMHDARQNHISVVDSRDRVYVMGGKYLSTGTHEWVDPVSLPTDDYEPYRPLTGIASIGGVPNIPAINYPVFGIQPATAGTPVNTSAVERFDPVSNAWERLSDLPEPVSQALVDAGSSDLTATIDDQDRPVVSWYTTQGLPASVIKTARFDPQTNVWTRMPDLNFHPFGVHARLYARIRTIRNRILLYVAFFPAASLTQPDEGVWVYELQNDQWIAKARSLAAGGFQTALYNPFIVDPNDRFYLIGGVPEGTSLPSFQFTAVTDAVLDGTLSRSCFNQKSKVIGPVSVLANTQEMVETFMEPIKVQITQSHLDPCHPQTQAKPLRQDTYVWVRGPLDQKVKG